MPETVTKWINIYRNEAGVESTGGIFDLYDDAVRIGTNCIAGTTKRLVATCPITIPSVAA